MTTDSRHRSPVLRAVREVEAGAGLPWDADLAVSYGSRDALLVAVHDHWSRQLLSRIDVALELGADSPEASVAMAWRSAVRDQPGVRRLLDAEADNPALRSARRHLLVTVAVAAGRATFDDPTSVSVAAGAQVLAAIDARPADGHRPALLARLLRRLWDGGPAADPFPWAA